MPTYPIDKKLSKHEILRKAIKYIRLLEGVLQYYEEAEKGENSPLTHVPIPATAPQQGSHSGSADYHQSLSDDFSDSECSDDSNCYPPESLVYCVSSDRE